MWAWVRFPLLTDYLLFIFIYEFWVVFFFLLHLILIDNFLSIFFWISWILHVFFFCSLHTIYYQQSSQYYWYLMPPWVMPLASLPLAIQSVTKRLAMLQVWWRWVSPDHSLQGVCVQQSWRRGAVHQRQEDDQASFRGMCVPTCHVVYSAFALSCHTLCSTKTRT